MGGQAQQRSGATAARNENAPKAAIGKSSRFPVPFYCFLSLYSFSHSNAIEYLTLARQY
jgi:hypothetical protein